MDDKNHPNPLTRRQFLVLSLGAAAAAAVPAHLTGAAPTPMAKAAASAAELESFVQLSALLTGIAAEKLAPAVDPVNIKQVYFDLARKESGDTFQQLLSIFDQNQGKPPDEIAEIILTQSGAAVGNLARTLMLVWYLGSWYAPRDPPQYSNFPSSTVVSPDAYTQGWVWRVAQAHPMGFSPLIFGYWGQTPPPLSDFIVPGDQS